MFQFLRDSIEAKAEEIPVEFTIEMHGLFLLIRKFLSIFQ